jgi:hypothetical protein
MFDPPAQHKLSEDYPPGTPFAMLSATYNGLQDTEYGPRATASVIVTPEVGPSEDARDYRVFGTLAEQVEQMGEAELPAIVQIVKDGRRFVWQHVRDLPPHAGDPTGHNPADDEVPY